jgi:hypothetical protein
MPSSYEQEREAQASAVINESMERKLRGGGKRRKCNNEYSPFQW